jgi:hypothetical protein
MSGDNNTVFGQGRFSWREFDALPARLRQVLNDSAFDMGADWIVRQLDEGVSPLDLAAELELLDAATRERAARQAYGPGYPTPRRS